MLETLCAQTAATEVGIPRTALDVLSLSSCGAGVSIRPGAEAREPDGSDPQTHEMGDSQDPIILSPAEGG